MANTYKKVIEVVLQAVDATRDAFASFQNNLKTAQGLSLQASSGLQGLGKAAQTAAAGAEQATKAAVSEATAMARAASEASRLSTGQDAVGTSAAKAAGAMDRASEEARDLAQAQSDATTKGLSLVDAMTRFASIAGQLAGMAFPVTQAAQFERKLAEAMAVMGEAGEGVQKFRELTQELGRTTEYTASQAAEGLLMLARAGIKGADAMGALPTALKLAQAGAMDLGVSADIVTNIMTGFKLSVDTLPAVADKLTAAFTNSNSTLQELGQSFKYVGPIAAGVGSNFDDVTAAIAALHNAGLKADMAGTALRGTLSALMNPTKEEALLLEDLGRRMGGAGLQIFDAQGKFVGFVSLLQQLEKASITAGEALELFGDRAGVGMAALLNQGSAAVAQLRTTIEQSEGTVDRISRQMNENLVGAWRNFKSAMEGLAISIGQQVQGPLSQLLSVLTNVINQVTNLAKAYPELTQVLTLAAGAYLTFSTAAKAIDLLKMVMDVKALTSAFSLLQQGAVALSTQFGVLGGALAAGIFVLATQQVMQLAAAIRDATAASEGLVATAQQYQNNALAFQQYKDVVIAGETEISQMREQQLRDYFAQLQGALDYYKNMMIALEAQAQERNWLLMQTEAAKEAEAQLAVVKGRYDEILGAMALTGQQARMLGIDLLDAGQKQVEATQQAIDYNATLQQMTGQAATSTMALQEAMDALVDRQTKVAEQFVLVAQSGQATAAQLMAAFQKTLGSLSNVESIEMVRQAIKRLGDEGVLSVEQVKWAMAELDDKARGVADSMDPVVQAYRTLRVESTAALQRTAEEARQAFETIRRSGEASAHDIKEAFLAYARAAMEAARATGEGAVSATRSLLETQASALNLEKALREAGIAGAEAGQQIAESMQQASQAMEEAAQKAQNMAEDVSESFQQGAGGETVKVEEKKSKAMWKPKGWEEMSEYAQREVQRILDQWYGPTGFNAVAKQQLDELVRNTGEAVDKMDELWAKVQTSGVNEALARQIEQWKAAYGALIDPSVYADLTRALDDYRRAAEQAMSAATQAPVPASTPSSLLAKQPAAPTAAASMTIEGSRIASVLDQIAQQVSGIARVASGLSAIDVDQLVGWVVDRLSMSAMRA